MPSLFYLFPLEVALEDDLPDLLAALLFVGVFFAGDDFTIFFLAEAFAAGVF